MVRDALEEGRARKRRVKRPLEEKEDRLARSFHITLLFRKLWQVVRWVTDRVGGGVSPPGGRLHKDRATGCIHPPGEIPWHECTPVENPMCAAFEE